jgi:hypothetical protein
VDDFVAALEAFENVGAEFLSPREYARLRNIVPQRVYYFVKQGKINLGPCECCGRNVIRVADADNCFGRFARRPIDDNGLDEGSEGTSVLQELPEVSELE